MAEDQTTVPLKRTAPPGIVRFAVNANRNLTQWVSITLPLTLRPKQCKLVESRALARIVTDKLRSLWSPEQIAGWLKHTYPLDESHHVSHETIYRSLLI